jgi:hypothetical protein
MSKTKKQLIALAVIFTAGVPISLKFSPPVHGDGTPAVVTTTTRIINHGSSRCVYEGTCDPSSGNEAPTGDSHGWDY